MRPVKVHRAPASRSPSPSRGSGKAAGENQGKAPKWGKAFNFFSFLGIRRNRKREYTLLKSRLYTGFGVIGFMILGLLYALDYPQQCYQQGVDFFLKTSQKMGFRVADIVVVGRQQATAQDLLTSIDLKAQDPIFKYSPQEIREKLKEVSWVKDAQVQRRLPHTFFIKIQERTPMALWQHHQKHVVVDDEGVVLTQENLKNYKHLPIVVGTDAPRHVSKILSILVKYPEVHSRVSALIWVGGRRWNLKMDRSIDVKLPEEGLEGALESLKKVLAQDKINFNQVKSIDLRLPKQTTLRLSGAAEMQLLGKGFDA